jgi:hypothetical protein
MNKQTLIDIFEKHTPNTEMSEDETSAMFSILMSDNNELSVDINDIDKESEVYKHFKPLIESFQAQVFLGRIKHLTTLKISLGALIIFMHHMESAGKAVMLAFYLNYKLPVNKFVSIETIAQVFPWGFFSEEQMNEIWNAQKVRVDDRTVNMIDNSEIWK